MNIRPFEIALIGFFAIMGVVGVIALSLSRSGPSEEEQLYGDRVSIWGTVDEAAMNEFLKEVYDEIPAMKVVSYRQIDARNFEDTVVNAIAEGKSPDLLMMPHAFLVSMRTKLMPISFDTFPERTFKDNYIDGASIFMRQDGVYGIPFAVDPLMMYWNRDLFAGAGIAQPPSTWENVLSSTITPLTEINDRREIVQSALAFGEYDNVQRAKEILSMLLLQAGTTIVDERADGYSVTLDDDGASSLAPGQAALGFYSQFALPNRETYSWNRNEPLDKTAFTSGNLALYFGLGSEWRSIEKANPNLNYDVTGVPQGAGATTLRTYGEFYAFAIPRASQKVQGAYATALLLSSAEYGERMASVLDLAPTHRALYGAANNDAFRSLLYKSALISRGWLDPSPVETDRVFEDMIEEAASGNTRYGTIIDDGARVLETLF